jgi:hypothetical protein
MPIFTLFSQAIHVRCIRAARYQHRKRNETGMTYSVWAHRFAKGGLKDRRCASCACRTPTRKVPNQSGARTQAKPACSMGTIGKVVIVSLTVRYYIFKCYRPLVVGQRPRPCRVGASSMSPMCLGRGGKHKSAGVVRIVENPKNSAQRKRENERKRRTGDGVCVLFDPRNEFLVRLYFRTWIMLPRCQIPQK